MAWDPPWDTAIHGSHELALENLAIALEFFTVPTATFQVLFVLVVLSHGRSRLAHFNVTELPTAE